MQNLGQVRKLRLGQGLKKSQVRFEKKSQVRLGSKKFSFLGPFWSRLFATRTKSHKKFNRKNLQKFPYIQQNRREIPTYIHIRIQDTGFFPKPSPFTHFYLNFHTSLLLAAAYLSQIPTLIIHSNFKPLFRQSPTSTLQAPT